MHGHILANARAVFSKVSTPNRRVWRRPNITAVVFHMFQAINADTTLPTTTGPIHLQRQASTEQRGAACEIHKT